MYQTVTDEDVLEEYADHLISNYITILAIKLTNYWREFFPYSADAWMYSGLALSQKIGQEKNAEDTFKKAISLSPLEADYYLELGSFYESFEEYEESLNCYLDAASRIFNVPDIYYAIGIVYAKAASCTVLCFIPPQNDEIEIALKYNLTLTISSIQQFEHFQKKVRDYDHSIDFHLKVDTGMTRQGCTPDEAWEIAVAYRSLERIPLIMRGIYTHFSCDSNILFTQNQLNIFLNTTSKIQKLLGYFLIKHAANSGGALFIPESRLDMVRIGIVMYGAFSPIETQLLPFEQKPVMKLVSYISLIKFVAKGTAVSYHATWVAKEDTYVAIAIIGYADGFPRSASNHAFVSIRGKKYPQVGNVTMDQIVINIGMEHGISVGDEVVIFGNDLISVTDFAKWSSTISYECLTSVSERLSREED
ncbi:hypothetical protein CHS0354_023959 [Potamilus streckersoni]|uniref:Alanine racemase C-terminal domain-containing protein n=1 Tax=Potamilus streckersoni TaxID=2493646 RepID=A0AAE0RZK1_9BIVA|nr:hypothetical protein CHS0354_023959 [Potamilus streckersoni]